MIEFIRIVRTAHVIVAASALAGCSLSSEAPDEPGAELSRVEGADYVGSLGVDDVPERIQLAIELDRASGTVMVTSERRVRTLYTSPPAAAGAAFRVELLDNLGRVIATHGVVAETPDACDPGSLIGQPSATPQPQRNLEAVVVAASENAASYRVVDASDRQRLAPRLVPGGDPGPAEDFYVLREPAQTVFSGHPTKPVRVRVLGDRFTSVAALDAAVRPMIADLSRHTAIRPYSSNIEWVFGQTDFDLGCWFNDRLLFCNSIEVGIAAATAPHDFVAVVVNAPQYGGLFTGAFMTVSSAHSQSVLVFAHELAHMIFGLADEYVDDAYWASVSVPYGPNCSVTPYPGAHAGCQKSGWWRSSLNSIMRSFNEPNGNVFNALSNTVISNRLHELTAWAPGSAAGTPLHLVTGPNTSGGPHVRTFDRQLLPVLDVFPYAASFTGGVRVALGDVTGDGQQDFITAAGPGGGPHVRVFDGVTGVQVSGAIGSFFAYAPTFTGGVYVAAGDVNADGRADVITGAGGFGGPHVRVFSGATGAELFGFMAYTPSFTGGVRVAAGDVNGDGYADIVTGAGPSGTPHVTVVDGRTRTLRSSFMAGYGTSFTGGIFVAACDVNRDNVVDIVVSPDAGMPGRILAYSGAFGELLKDFVAFPSTVTQGVRVACGDVYGDGAVKIVAAPGSGGGTQVRVFDPFEIGYGANHPTLGFIAIEPYPSFIGGSFIGVAP